MEIEPPEAKRIKLIVANATFTPCCYDLGEKKAQARDAGKGEKTGTSRGRGWFSP